MTKNSDESSKDPMSPEKIKKHEPTAVKRDPDDQEIVEGGQTGTDTPEAKEKLRKSGMTQV
ncbi:MAG: hypothetical protein E6K94_05885 [Thaumarchaeota archaeon]|jgi:hypothetical protein|nr:MAG: hypothetical protein E6L01_01705 [Nitrososphaerota archaeon]TLX90941.1 MAG: hypothetical protein E6K94_05885 [Nitrososphaerota archaeon]